MAAQDQTKNLVDISSGKQIRKVYNKKGRVKRILCIIFSVIFLIGGSGMMYYYSLLNSLNYEDLGNETQKPNQTSQQNNNQVDPMSGDKTNLTLDGNLLEHSKILNIMLFGEDNRKGNDYGRSDTMIMLSIDNVHKKIKMTSFQRDTYVYIPGYGYNKINASYTLGGAQLAVKTIESNFGVAVDRYAVVDFKSFKSVIDAMGGIDLELTADEIGYINWQLYKNHQSDTDTTLTDPPGMVHLNGQQALWYARDRGASKEESGIGFDGDDWDRTSRQRKLLEKLFSDFKQSDITQIISIVSSIGPMITTNLKKDEITALVTHALTYLKYEIVQYNIPEKGLWYYDDNTEVGSVIRISDLTAQRQKFASFIFEELVSFPSDSTSSTATE